METGTVEVLAPNAKPAGTFEAVSYTVFADGHLGIALADGSSVSFDVDEWMDVKFLPA